MSEKTIPKDQIVALKDANTLKTIYSLLERKKYKQCITVCDTFLALYPNNGEALSAKGLCLSYSTSFFNEEGKKIALDFCKRGVASNPDAHEVWHMLGLYYKHEKMYKEACDAYTKAEQLYFKNNPENSGSVISRDIGYFQAQSRNWSAFAESRRATLLRPNSLPRINFPGSAVANHLAGNLDVAISLMKAYIYSLKQAKLIDPEHVDTEDYDPVVNSECNLYLAKLYMENGEYVEPLALMAELEDEITDTLSLHHMRAEAYIHIEDYANSVKEFEWLMKLNPDNRDFHDGLMKALQIDYSITDCVNNQLGDKYDKLKAFYEDLSTKYPGTSTVTRIPLEFLRGDDFQTAVYTYLKRGIVKGIPSLFKDMRSLYIDVEKKTVIVNIMLDMYKNLKENNRFTVDDEIDSAAPGLNLWAAMYLTSHYDYEGDAETALKYIDQAIEHTPTLLDLYMLKAGVYKHSGDIVRAHHWMDYARNLDRADRYVNNKSARYAAQAGNNNAVECTMRLFVKEEDLEGYFYNNQNSWYHTQQGLCLRNKGVYGLALKKLISVEDHFEAFYESLYDYHLYILRKGTFRAYTDLVRYLDSVRKHKFYVRAVTNLVDLYLHLDKKQKLEKITFAKRVVKNTTATVDQYLSNSLPEDVRANIEAKANSMKQDCEVLLKINQDNYTSEYEETPQFKERTEMLNKRKPLAESNDDRFPYGLCQPENDYYGFKFVTPGTNYLKEAKKFSSLLIDAAFTNNLPEHNPTQDTLINNKTTPIVTSVLFLAVETAISDNKPLLAIRQLTKAIKAVDVYNESISSGKTTAIRAAREQIVGLPWYCLDGIHAPSKAQLLPHYYQAEILLLQSKISLLFKNYVSYNSDVTTSAIKDNKNIITDVVANVKNYVTSQQTTLGKLIAVSVAILIIGEAKNAGVDVDVASEINTLIESVISLDLDHHCRSAARSIIKSINYVSGVTIAAEPSIEGIQLTTEDVGVVHISSINIDEFMNKARVSFPNDLIFMEKTAYDDIISKYTVEVEFVPCEEDKEGQ